MLNQCRLVMVFDLPNGCLKTLEGLRPSSMSYRISIDTPALFITAVGKDRLPIFQANKIKDLTCAAIDEARTSAGFLLFAYVLMPDHLHMLTDAPLKPSVVLQYIKGIVPRRVINHLKEQDYESSLQKLRHADWKRNHRFSLWQHDSDVFPVTSESKFMEKVNYINLNPVRTQCHRWATMEDL
jgi:REP-associated tyrosine transposase